MERHRLYEPVSERSRSQRLPPPRADPPSCCLTLPYSWLETDSVGPSLQVASGEIVAAGRAADAKPGFRADYLHGVLPEEATQTSQVRLR